MKPALFTRWKGLVPPRWRRRVRRMFGAAVFVGDYPSWGAALKDSDGYDNAAIQEKTINAARAVREGQAAWERDTVLFAEPSYNAPLLQALRRAAATDGGSLNLVDFGGALGSTWWQHRNALQDLSSVRWSIIERPALVAVGQREFSIPPLRFFASLEECCATERPSVMLLSSVLPYVENPHALLDEVRQRGFRHLIIDRTGLLRPGRGRDRLTVRRVPPSIYPASYPSWFFDRGKLLQPFAAGWRLVAEWATDDETDIDAEYGGLYLERKW